MKIYVEQLNSADGPIVAPLAHGFKLESSAENYLSGEYVTIVGPDGNEIAHWVCEEWQSDPVVVMGAIVNMIAAIQRFGSPDAVLAATSRS